MVPLPTTAHTTPTQRFNLHTTLSFQDLNPWWQKELRQLHDDYLYQRQDTLWRAHALHTLPPLLSSTNMLVFAEDLGLVPACLPDIMHQLGLIGADGLTMHYAWWLFGVCAPMTDHSICAVVVVVVVVVVVCHLSYLGTPLGLRIQRMGGADGAAFGDPATYPYMTVASPSCHDVSNLRAWWEEDRDTQRCVVSPQ